MYKRIVAGLALSLAGLVGTALVPSAAVAAQPVLAAAGSGAEAKTLVMPCVSNCTWSTGVGTNKLQIDMLRTIETVNFVQMGYTIVSSVTQAARGGWEGVIRYHV